MLLKRFECRARSVTLEFFCVIMLWQQNKTGKYPWDAPVVAVFFFKFN